MGILPIRPEVFEKSSKLISDTFELIRRADPDLDAECEALLRIILLGEGPTDKTALTASAPKWVRSLSKKAAAYMSQYCPVDSL